MASRLREGGFYTADRMAQSLGGKPARTRILTALPVGREGIPAAFGRRSELARTSLGAQGDHRVDTGGAARGNVTSDERHQG